MFMILSSAFVAFVGTFILSPVAAIRFLIVACGLVATGGFLLFAFLVWGGAETPFRTGLIHAHLLHAGISFALTIFAASIGNRS
jgi:hypothetical protein